MVEDSFKINRYVFFSKRDIMIFIYVQTLFISLSIVYTYLTNNQ